MGEHEWSNDGSVAFNDKLWSVSLELAPSDFLIGHSAGIAAVTGRGIANLAEVRPARAFQAEILMEHRYHADWEITRDTAADLKEPHGASLCLSRAALGGQGWGSDLRFGALAH